MRTLISTGSLALGLLLVLIPLQLTIGIGTLFILLAVLVVLNATEDAAAKARWMFAGVFVIIAGIAATLTEQSLHLDNQRQDIASQLMLRSYALVVGVSISLGITLLLFLLTIYISGAYVLALQKVEGITGGQAFRSVFSLITNTNFDWLIVEDGKVTRTKKGGILKKFGGPGKVVIQPGNAVVFERAGKISRIAGAGVVLTKRVEVIRKIINLQKQFHMETFEAVTADKITVKIEAAVVYQILPAGETPGGKIITDNENLYPVTEETLKRAVFSGTAGGWEGFCQGSPMAVIRDQIMARTVDELFDFDIQATDAVARMNSRVIREIEETALEQASAAAPGMGAKIIMVDIRSIKLPKSVHDQVAKERRLRADLKTARDLEQARKDAKKDLIREVLHAVKDYTGGQPLDARHIEMATQLINASARIQLDDVYGRERLEMLEKMAKSDGTKVISTGGTPPPVESPISLGND